MTMMTVTTPSALERECAAQDSALVLVYTITTVILPMTALPFGLLMLHGGMRLTRNVFTIMMSTAYLCLAFSSPATAGLLYPAAILLGTGGYIILVGSFEVGNLVPSKKSTIIGMLNGCYDASSLVFMIVKIAYEDGVSLQDSSLFLFGSCLIFIVSTILLPKDHIPWPLPRDYRLCRACAKSEDEKMICEQDSSASIDRNSVGMIADSKDSKNRLGYNTFSTSAQNQAFELDNLGFEKDTPNGDPNNFSPPGLAPDVENGIAGAADEIAPSPSADTVDAVSARINCDVRVVAARSIEASAENARVEEYPTILSCVRSLMFLFLCLWTIVKQVQILFVFAIMNSWLTWLSNGDLQIVSWYTDVLAITSLISLVTAPITGTIMERQNVSIWSRRTSDSRKSSAYGPYTELHNSCLALTLTVVVSIAFAVCMLFRVLPLQYLTFVLIMVARSMVYASSSAVVPVIFPMKFYGVVYGIMYFIMGLFGMLQYPLFILIEDRFDGNPRYVMIGFILANVLTLSFPAYIIYYVKAKTRMIPAR